MVLNLILLTSYLIVSPGIKMNLETPNLASVSGHKTMACFKRHNLVTEKELAAKKWTPEEEKNPPPIATNMDTNEKGATAKSP